MQVQLLVTIPITFVQQSTIVQQCPAAVRSEKEGRHSGREFILKYSKDKFVD